MRMNIFGFKKKQEYSAKEILKQLDKCAEDFTFPMLDNGYVYPIHSKMSAYRDEKQWALIIEVIGFNYRGGGHDGISNCLHIFGNCIDTKPGTDNANFLYITDNSADNLTFDEEYLESLIDFIPKNIKTNHILDGLGEVLSENQKDWARSKLQPLLLMEIQNKLIEIS